MAFYATPREKEVLKMVLEGMSSKAVADKLCVSKRTVDFHLANVYGKLEVKSRMQAANKLVKLGIKL
jgi:DNA-binding CsgD family transcriptional regulator